MNMGRSGVVACRVSPGVLCGGDILPQSESHQIRTYCIFSRPLIANCDTGKGYLSRGDAHAYGSSRRAHEVAPSATWHVPGRVEYFKWQGRRHGFLSGGGGVSNCRQGCQSTPKYPKNRKNIGFWPPHSRIWGSTRPVFKSAGVRTLRSPRRRRPCQMAITLANMQWLRIPT